jgi:hypothetical protein
VKIAEAMNQLVKIDSIKKFVRHGPEVRDKNWATA